jgi:hypothetical protein
MKYNNYFLFIIAMLLTITLFSQTPSETDKQTESKKHWTSSIDIGAALYSGNVDKQDLRGILSFVRSDELLELALDVKSILSKVDNQMKNKEYSLSSKVDYLPQKKISPFILLNAYQDIPKGYKYRFGGYLGGKWIMSKSDKSNYSISAAYLFETQKTPKDGENSGSSKSESKLSFRFKIKQAISQFATLNLISFYTPAIKKFNDYRIDLEASLSSKLTSKILMKFGYTFNYVNVPPKSNIKKTDQALVTSIMLEF